MAVSVTGSPILALNTATTVTKNAATADVDGTAEVFTITPTKAGIKGLIIIGGTGSAADGNITATVTAGALWGGQAQTYTITKNTEKMIQVDTGIVMSSSGTILVSLDPADTDKLKTDHSAYVNFIEML